MPDHYYAEDYDGIGRRTEDDPNLVTGSLNRRDYTHNGQDDDGSKLIVAQGVRRLTPRECERLQGFPDGWTDLGGTPDSKRYAALGDAVTVPVAEWIGRRLMAVAA